MNRVLLIVVAAMMISSVAMADYINVYSDEAGDDCHLSRTGFTQTATLVYKGWTPYGSSGARFKVQGPAGSTIISLTTPYMTIGNVASDLSIAFGECIPGTFTLGTLSAVWATGNTGAVLPADGLPDILMTACPSGEYPGEYPVTGGRFCVGETVCDFCGPVGDPIGIEQSTWGKVKALYR